MFLGPLRGGLDALPRPRRDDHRTRIAGRHKHSLDGLGPAVRRQGEVPQCTGSMTSPRTRRCAAHRLLGAEVPVGPRAGRTAPTSIIVRSNGPSRSPIVAQARKEPGVARVVDPVTRAYERVARP